MVSTYLYAPASTAAAPVGMVDSLDNFEQMDSRSNLYIIKNNPGFFDNDGGRVTRSTTEPGSIVYHTDYDIRSFTVYSSFITGVPIEAQRFFVSTDGKKYKEISAEAGPSGYQQSNWQPYAYDVSSTPAHTRFLKIMLVGSAKAWSPQISKVVLNQNTASVSWLHPKPTGR